ncbi:hypothetical protein V6Z11_A09G075400 [Gossypium hirsutum]
MTFCSVFIKNAAKISLHNISLHGSLIAAAIYLGWIIFTGCCEYHEDDESDEEFSPKKIGAKLSTKCFKNGKLLILDVELLYQW